jgi:hypothetical protein
MKNYRDDQSHKVLTGWQELAELVAIIGNERETQRLLFTWTNMAGLFAGEQDDFFTGPDPEKDAERLKKMRSVVKHISALIPLLDPRTAWLVAVAAPRFSEGPEVADAAEARLSGLVQSLASLRTDIEHAAASIKPRKGRPLLPTPLVMLLVSLVGHLEELGVAFSDAENSKMVRAVRLFWQAAGLDGDPRDSIRTLKARR